MSIILFLPLALLVFVFGPGAVALVVYRRVGLLAAMVLAVPVLILILVFGAYLVLKTVALIVVPGGDSLPVGTQTVRISDGLPATPPPKQAIADSLAATGKAAAAHAPKAEAEEAPPALPPRPAGQALGPVAAEEADQYVALYLAAEEEEPSGPAVASGGRPSWVGASPRRTEAGYQISVATDPFASPLECERQLPQVLRRAVDQYVALYLGDPSRAAHVELPLDFIRTEIVKAQWEEPYESSVGPMVRLHALLVFDRKTNARIDEAVQQRLAYERVGRLGAILAGVLAALGIVWAYLRLDLATEGRYRRRLRIAAAAAILAVVAAGWVMLG